jgi:hypothetical protein
MYYYDLLEELPSGTITLKLFRNSNLSGLGAGGAFFVDMLGLLLMLILT